MRKHEQYCVDTVGKVSQYFCKLHNILQAAERNTLIQIKQIDNEFKNNLNMIESKTNKSIKNFEDMITALQIMAKDSQKIHLKKVADSTKKFLEYTGTAPSFPILTKSPFEVSENAELEKMLKELRLLKINEETEKSDDTLELPSNITFENESYVMKEKYENSLASLMVKDAKNNLKSTKDLYDVQMMKSTQSSLNYDFPVSTTTSKSKIENPVNIQMAKVSYFNNPLDFYVQFDTFLSIEKSLKTECAIDADLGGETPNNIEIGYIYLIKTNANIWERGKILEEARPQTYRARLIDTGEVILIPKQQIILMSTTLRSKEGGAKKCSIYGIEDKRSQKDWGDEVNALAKDLILKKTVFVVVLKKTEEISYVDLVSTNIYPISFRGALIFTDLAEPAILTDKKLMSNLKCYNSNKRKDLIPNLNRGFYPAAVDELTEIRITPLNVVSPSEFYVLQYEYQTELVEFNLELKNFYSKNCIKVYWPRINMKCAVEINGNWYRCKVIKVHEKLKIDIFLVDQGQFRTVQYTQLSFLDKSHCKVCEYSFRCSLIDIEPVSNNWTSDALMDFKRMMTHSHLKILIHSKNHNNHAVTLMILQKQREINVNALLVEYKYAISTGTESIVVNLLEKKTLFQTSEKIRKENPANVKNSFLELKNVTDDQISIPTPAMNVSRISQQNSPNFGREEVVITHTVSPGEIYLHPKKYANGIAKLHDHIQKYQEKILNDNPEYQMKYDWKLNDNCLVFTDLTKIKNKEWYRAVIIGIENDESQRDTKFTIYLRDYGKKISNLSNNDLSPMRISDVRICDAATKCHLACVKPTGGTNIWSNGSIDHLNGFINKYQTICATIQGQNINNSIPVILWGLLTEISDALSPTIYKYVNINKTLNSLGFVELIEKFDRDKQIMRLTDVTKQDELNNLDLLMKMVDDHINKVPGNMESDEKEDDEFYNSDTPDDTENFTGWLSTTINKTLFTAYPTYVDHDGYIYLHDATNAYILEKIKKIINKKFADHVSSTEKQTIDFRPGEPCIALYHGDSLYHRAEIVEVLNDIIKVCFIDYGNVEECTRAEIIKKVIFKKIPRQAVKFRLYGIEPNTSDGKWPQDTLDLMHISIVTKLCSVDVKGTDENCASIKKCLIKADSLNLTEFLIEHNLAKRSVSSPKTFEAITRFNTDNHAIKASTKRDESCLVKYLEDDDEDIDISFNKDDIIIIDDGDCGENKVDVNIGYHDTNSDSKKQKENVETIPHVKNKKKKKKMNEPNLSSSDDETEMFYRKQKKFENMDPPEHTDVETYQKIFQKEELNKFYTSAISESGSSDEIDVDLDCTYQSWNERADPNFLQMYKKDEACIELLAEDKENNVSTIDSFDPIDSSTVISPFEGVENFQFYKLPYGLKEFYCEVHYIENLTKFYISPIVTDLHKQYFEMMKRIQAYVKISHSNFIEVESNSPCLALFNEDNLYYRSIIKEIHPTLNKAEVLYVDFFNTDSVSFSNIKKCPNQFMNYPLRLTPVQLRGIKTNPRWRESDIKSQLSRTLNNKKIFTEIIKTGKIPEVQFYESKKNRISILKDLYDKKIFLPDEKC